MCNCTDNQDAVSYTHLVVIRDGKGEDLGDIVELKRGESLKLKVKSLWEEGRVKIAWGSDAPKIVEVDQNGRVQGLKAGKATITAAVNTLSLIHI